MLLSTLPLGGVAPSELLVVVAIILLLFGGKKIPELMKGLGTGIKEFKDATRETNTNSVAPKKTDSELVEKQVVESKVE